MTILTMYLPPPNFAALRHRIIRLACVGEMPLQPRLRHELFLIGIIEILLREIEAFGLKHRPKNDALGHAIIRFVLAQGGNPDITVPSDPSAYWMCLMVATRVVMVLEFDFMAGRSNGV